MTTLSARDELLAAAIKNELDAQPSDPGPVLNIARTYANTFAGQHPGILRSDDSVVMRGTFLNACGLTGEDAG